MKKLRPMCTLFSALLLTSAVTAPQASAADCTWTVQDLPVPAGANYAQVEGSSPNNNLIVGSTSFEDNRSRGVVWTNGVLSLMTESLASVQPKAVNDSGIIVGEQRIPASPLHLERAFRYENGNYERLFTESQEQSRATGINATGDVIGEVWLKSSPSTRWVAMWPKGEPRRLYSKGLAVGISDDRKIVMRTPVPSNTPSQMYQAWVVDGSTGRWTILPDVRSHFIVLDDDRVLEEHLGDGATQVREWNLAGEPTGTYLGGSNPHGRNSSDTIFTSSIASVAVLWKGDSRRNVEADRQPAAVSYGDITDSGVLISNYRDADGTPHPARWFCS